jgi:alkylhydroperoxidase family enzyme
MGHTEMALAVAGLDQKQIGERVRQLASGTWDAFPPAERAAFRFAHKQAKDPASVEPRDVRQLIQFFGPERALDVVWWACRCHYMTCVSDAFQLPLEDQNVFDGFPPPVTSKE